jgi:hypothetical protein
MWDVDTDREAREHPTSLAPQPITSDQQRTLRPEVRQRDSPERKPTQSDRSISNLMIADHATINGFDFRR